MSALPRPSRILVVASLLVSAGLLDRVDAGAEEEITAQISDGADRIQPGSNHPTYWRYEGEPVQLVDGSGEDHLFQGEGTSSASTWTGSRRSGATTSATR
jgi:hypothetical protein